MTGVNQHRLWTVRFESYFINKATWEKTAEIVQMAVTADRKVQVGELSSSSSVNFWTVFNCCLQILEKEVS